ELAGGDAQRRQRNAAPDAQTLDQHAPALADVLLAADQPVERNEHLAPAGRPVLKAGVQRIVALADLDPGRVGRNQRERDAALDLAAEQALGVVQLEREAEHGGDRAERNVALLTGEADDEDVLAAAEAAAADDAVVGHGGGVAARFRPGEREAGNFLAAGETRQVMVLLRVGAVVQQQLGGAERVRHHDRHGRRHAARGDLHHDFGVRLGRELESAVLLGNDHAEEALAPQELPDIGRQVLALADLPVVQHAAQLLHRAVEKSALLDAQGRRRHVEQPAPARPAAEELGLPPDRARFDRRGFGGRDRRQQLAEQVEHAIAHQPAPQRRQVERQRQDQEH